MTFNNRILLFTSSDRQNIKELIEQNGNYSCESVCKIEDLFDSLKKNPGFVITDYKVPELNDFEIIDRLIEYKNDIQIIIVTDQSSEEAAIESILRGAKLYLRNDNRLISNLFTFLTKNKLKHKNDAEDTETLTTCNSQHGVLIIDVISGIAKASDQYFRMLGYAPNGRVETKESFIAKIHPDDFQYSLELFDKFAGGKTDSFRCELRMKTSQNDFKWFLVNASITKKDFQGNPLEIVLSHTDINDLRLREKAIKESQLQVKEFSDLGPAGILILDIDKRKIIEFNNATLDIYGYTRDEILDLSIADLSSDPIELDTIISGLSKQEHKFTTSFRYHLRKDGTIFPVQLISNFLTIDGKELLVEVVKDLTPIKEIEDILKNYEEKFKILFENADYPIGILKDGKHCFANDAYLRLTGYQNNFNLINKAITNLILPEEEKGTNLSNFWEGDNKKVEATLVKNDDSTLNVELSFSEYPLESESFTIVIIKDLTHVKLTEETRKENEIRFKTLFEETGKIPVQGLDLDHKIVYWNRASERTYGYTKEEAIGKKIEELIAPVYLRSDIAKDIDSVVNNISVPSKEYPLLKKDGSLVYMFTNKVKIFNYKGIPEIYSIDIDNSEYKSAEATLKKLSTAVEQSPASIFITNREGEIEYVNQKCITASGYSYDELMGQNPRIFKSENTTPEEYKELWEVITAGKPWKGEILNRKKDGSLYWELELISPIKNENDEITHFLAIKEDITESKKSAEYIINSEAQFRSVWENSFDAMRLTNEDGDLLKVNDAFCDMFFMKREELEGKPLSIIYDRDLQEHSISTFQINFSKHTVRRQFEAELFLWNGKSIWVELSNSFIEIDGKKPLLLSIFRDISERKRFENDLIKEKEKALEMSKLKSNFLNNMSHEIRTPMVGILGFSQILFNEIESPELKEMTEEIIKSSNRMMNTINSILDLSRIEANKMDVNTTNFYLLSEIEETIKPLKAIAEQNRLYLNINEIEKQQVVSLDRHLFSQIISNLVGNAIKYTKDGGVTIEIEKEMYNEEYWSVINIVDTGIGIPKHSLDIIFDEFRQVSEGLNRQFEGTGLGLTITKKLTELMNGKITVESKLGVGSKFTVKFPLKNVETPALEPEKDFKVGVIDFNEPKNNNELPYVLLVENDEVNQTVMKLFLKSICKLDIATNGEMSVDMCRDRKYSAILMDINLGTGMNGVEAAQAIHELKGYENAPIVAVTAYAMVGDKEKFLASGLSHYLSKPFDRETLVNLIKEIVKKQ